MRRYTFYLSIALLAFGIGSFMVFCFYWTYLSKNVAQQELMLDEVEPVEETAVGNTPRIEFHCDDKTILPVLKRLMKNKTFINNAYDNVIAPRHIKNCQELFDVKPINLTDDESDEFIVRGNYLLFCDSGGDCQTWIVSKNNNRYEIIFESTTGDFGTTSDSLEAIQSLGTKAHQFKDLKVFIPNGWETNNIGYFKFDGNRYRIKKCLRDANSAYDYDEIYDEKLLPVKLKECVKHNFF